MAWSADLDNLNYHHLRYFREVAHEGNLTRTAERVNLSQSALSVQIKNLEQRLGHALFDRVGRQLVLTEAGQIVLDYADRIFETGHELQTTLNRTRDSSPPLRIGALSTLSRNFQLQFLRPVLHSSECEINLVSGSESELLGSLKALALDVVLTTEPPDSDFGSEFTAHRLAEQTIGIHGHPSFLRHKNIRELLSNEPIILPTETAIRMGFESLVARLGIKPRIIARVDDMAMVRLLARENAGLAIAPSVVLANEIESGRIKTAPFDLEITETFYAVTIQRSFPHPLLNELIGASRAV